MRGLPDPFRQPAVLLDPDDAPKRRRRRNKHPAMRAFRIGAGILLIICSPLAVFVPFLLGPMMVLAGLSLLSHESRFARKTLLGIKLVFRRWKRSWRRRGAAAHRDRDQR